jgi:uncharacterized cupredoxin-like copper-binding protein
VKRVVLALALVAALALVVVPVAFAAVGVTGKEFKFTLTTKTVRHGKVTFKLTNKGRLKHDFKIAGKKTALIAPGKSGSVTVTLKKGSYTYICTVPGHAAAGMKGKLKVT